MTSIEIVQFMKILSLILLLSLVFAQNQLDMREEMIKRAILNRIFELEGIDPVDPALACTPCKLAMKKMRTFSETTLISIIRKEFMAICPKIKDLAFCNGIDQTYIDQFAVHYFNHLYDPQNACASLGVCEYSYKKQDLNAYASQVLFDKPTSERISEWLEIAQSKIQNTENYKVLHLADLHIDVEYKVGANAFCQDPFCCREENGMADDPSQGAQFWGTYAPCDLPLRTVANLVEFAGKEIKPDFIIWTGDSTSHDVWHQQQWNQTLPTRLITGEIKKHMPGVQVYAIFGNHEAYPADQYDMAGEKSQWLRDETSEMWKEYLDEQAFTSLKQKGFYAQVDKSRNLKVIAVNSQACDSLNFYLYDHITDPSGELAWLQEELQKSERENQFAFIFAHIPPGDTFCHTQWAQRFAVVIERYEHVVKGLFYGHTHQDHVEHIRSVVDGRFLKTAFIAPSGTTFSYQNPSFRVFEINGKDNEVHDYLQYRLDLDQANKDGPDAKLNWYPAYSFIRLYALENASLAEVSKLPQKLQESDILLHQYVFNFATGSDRLYQEKLKELHSAVYHESAKKFYVCGSQTAVFDDWYQCVGTLEHFKDYNFLTFKLLDGLAGKWRDDEDLAQEIVE